MSTGNYLAPVDPLAVYAVARGFYGELAHACSAELEAAYRTCKVEAAGVPYEVDEEQAARRCLAAYALWCLGVLCHGGAEASELAPAAKDAANVTEKVAALDALGRHPTAQMPREVAVDAFLERWKVDNTVICTYLSLMASIVHCQSPLELVKNTIRWNPTRSAA
jgi:aminopeptidase N